MNITNGQLPHLDRVWRRTKTTHPCGELSKVVGYHAMAAPSSPLQSSRKHCLHHMWGTMHDTLTLVEAISGGPECHDGSSGWSGGEDVPAYL